MGGTLGFGGGEAGRWVGRVFVLLVFDVSSRVGRMFALVVCQSERCVGKVFALVVWQAGSWVGRVFALVVSQAESWGGKVFVRWEIGRVWFGWRFSASVVVPCGVLRQLRYVSLAYTRRG